MYYLLIIMTLVTSDGVALRNGVLQYPNIALCEIAKDRIIEENRQNFKGKNGGTGALYVTGSCTATVKDKK